MAAWPETFGGWFFLICAFVAIFFAASEMTQFAFSHYDGIPIRHRLKKLYKGIGFAAVAFVLLSLS